MSVNEYLRLIFKHRYLLLGGLLIGLLVAVFSIATAERTYRGSVGFFISSAGEGTAVSANVGDQFALRRVNSYLALLRTDRLGQMVVEEADLDLSPRAVRNRISGSADLNTVLLTARVVDADRAQALLISEALSRAFPELVTTVETPTVGEPTVRLEVVSGPSVSEVPVRTNWILATRAMAGILLGAVVALGRELSDHRLHSIDRAVTMSKSPLLGLVTFDRRATKSPLILDNRLGSIRAEEYRQIRTSLQFVDADSHVSVIAVTSSVPSEGKSVTAANLAIAVARSGKKVAVVDADLRKPTVGRLFGVEQSVGLVDVLRGHAALADVLQPWGSFDLVVLPSGGSTTIPSELLGTVAMARMVGELRKSFDFVIIDSPPLVPVTDAAIISTLTDGVVLLVRPDKVTRAQLQRSLSNLEQVHANLLGIVGSMMPERSSPYASGYYYGDQPAEEEGVDAEEVPPPSDSVAASRGAKNGFLLEEALRRVPPVKARDRR